MVVQRTKMKMTFIFSPELTLNPDWYKHSRSGYFDVIYGQMKSVYLKYIIEGNGYVSTSIATSINNKTCENSVFPDVEKLPKTPL